MVCKFILIFSSCWLFKISSGCKPISLLDGLALKFYEKGWIFYQHKLISVTSYLIKIMPAICSFFFLAFQGLRSLNRLNFIMIFYLPSLFSYGYFIAFILEGRSLSFMDSFIFKYRLESSLPVMKSLGHAHLVTLIFCS